LPFFLENSLSKKVQKKIPKFLANWENRIAAIFKKV